MCLSVPAKVISIDGEMARASVNGVIVDVSIQLVDDVKIGDYILIHTGYALQILSLEEASDANENLKLLKNGKR